MVTVGLVLKDNKSEITWNWKITLKFKIILHDALSSK